jgi:protein-disulfide isomerase
MKKTLLSLSLLASLAAAGCQKESNVSKEMLAKLDQINSNIEKLTQTMVASGAGKGQAVGAAAAGGAPGAQQPARPRPPAPDAKATYAVPIEGSPSEGSSNALVTIVKAFEYACPFCEKVRPTTDQIKTEYKDNVRFVFKQFVVHPQVATDAALGSCAAARQGKYEAMDNLLWEKAFKARAFDRANIEALGKEAGLDVAKMKADMDGPCKEIIQKEQAEVSAVGTRGTPAFYINGRYLSGAQPYENFKKVIDEELKKAQERVAQGTKPADYYKDWVLAKGLKKVEAPPAEAVAPAPAGGAAPAAPAGGTPPIKIVPQKAPAPAAPAAPAKVPAPH